jgi:hypothetical protein
MPRKTFNVDLLHLAEPFGHWCVQRKQSRSVALRELVSNALEVHSEKVPIRRLPPAFVAAEPRPAQLRRIGVRLYDSELNLLRCRAADAGMSSTQYLKTLLTNAESGHSAIAGIDTVQALRDSNHQLSAVARKLIGALRDQINSQPSGESESIEMVADAIIFLRQHVDVSSTLLAEVERTRLGRRVAAGRGGNAWRGRQDAAIGCK